MKKYTKKSFLRHNLKIAIPVGILAVILLFAGLELTNIVNLIGSRGSTDSSQSPSEGPATTTEQPKNTAPASDSQNQKDQPTSQQSQNNQSGSNAYKNQATPEIAFVGQQGQNVIVRASVPSVAEDGGKCTATFTKSSNKASGSSIGFTNVSYTTCPQISVARSQFNSAGSWMLVVTYSSSSSEGISEGKTVIVQ